MMSWKETIFHKNKNFRFVLQCLFLYGACYPLYYCTSIGLDSADLRLASRQLLPPMLIFYVVQRVSGKTLLSRLWLTQFLTGMSWVITTPLLMYIQVGATATKLESMADILFGCYAALFLMSAQQLTAGRKHCLLFQSCTTILSLILMCIPLCEVVHFLTYGTCITKATLLSIRTEPFTAYIEFFRNTLGAMTTAFIALFYFALGTAIFKFNAHVFRSLPTLKSHASVVIFFLTFSILAVYLPNTLIKQTYFFTAWHRASVELRTHTKYEELPHIVK